MAKHISLAKFTPTEDELAAARTLLRSATTSQRNGKVNAMNQFLDANTEGEGNSDIRKEKPGEKNTVHIARYIAYQVAKKKRQDCQQPEQRQ